jgi:cysteine desulfurase
VKVAGPADRRAPHVLNVSFEGVDGEAAILAMDAAGLCVSSGSACASGSTKPSHVLQAMGQPPDVSKSSVRFSLSSLTTAADIDAAIGIAAKVVGRLRKISPVSR